MNFDKNDYETIDNDYMNVYLSIMWYRVSEVTLDVNTIKQKWTIS